MKSCESGDPDRVPRVQIRLGSGTISLHVKIATRCKAAGLCALEGIQHFI
jgi:hypothetical protein